MCRLRSYAARMSWMRCEANLHKHTHTRMIRTFVNKSLFTVAACGVCVHAPVVVLATFGLFRGSSRCRCIVFCRYHECSSSSQHSVCIVLLLRSFGFALGECCSAFCVAVMAATCCAVRVCCACVLRECFLGEDALEV